MGVGLHGSRVVWVQGCMGVGCSYALCRDAWV